jgi:hypothetical protein
MKTIEITLSNEEDFEKVNALLEQLKLEANLKILEKGPAVDPVTMLSQASLAEEWESDEDNRWDSIL